MQNVIRVGKYQYHRYKDSNYFANAETGKIYNAVSKIFNNSKRDGYISIGGNKKRPLKKSISGHKMIMEMFGEPKPSPKHQIDHINGIRTDNRLINLQWLTPKENAVKGGLQTGQPKLRKLSFVQAEHIRKKFDSRLYSKAEIARAYKIGVKSIDRIVKFKTYRTSETILKRERKIRNQYGLQLMLNL